MLPLRYNQVTTGLTYVTPFELTHLFGDKLLEISETTFTVGEKSVDEKFTRRSVSWPSDLHISRRHYSSRYCS